MCEEQSHLHTRTVVLSLALYFSSFASSSSFNHLCFGRRGLWGTREKKGQKENETRRESAGEWQRREEKGRIAKRVEGREKEKEKRGEKLAE